MMDEMALRSGQGDPKHANTQSIRYRLARSPSSSRTKLTERSIPRVIAGARRPLLAGLCCLAVLQALTAAVTAYSVAAIAQALLKGEPISHWPTFLAVAAIPLAAVFRWIERVQAEKLGQSYVEAIRKQFIRRTLQTPAAVLAGRAHGAMMLRFTGDMGAMRNWAARGIARLIVGATALTAGAATLFWLDPIVGLTFGVISLLTIGLAARLTANLGEKAKTARQARSNLARCFGEILASIGAYQTFGANRHAVRQVVRRAFRVREAAVGQARAAGGIQAIIEAATTAMPTLCLLATAIFGAEPAATFAGIAIASILSPRLRDLGRVAEYWTTAKIAQDRIESTFARMPRPRRAPYLEASAELGGVAFQQFSVPPMLRDISGQALAGERIALIGPNGAGKSMLLMALAGLAPHRGDLIIDGLQVARTLQGSLAGHIAYVGDAAPIIAGTVEKNLRLGAPDASNEDIQAAVERFELTSLSSRGERVGALGCNLSSGEQARLMIARALLANPRILLLDEVEANLDAASEALVWNAVQNFPGLVIYATHDPVRVGEADKVWRINDSRLVEQDLHNVVDAPTETQ